MRKLLVVDDIELNRLLLASLFSDDYIVLEASNGIEALDMIRAHENELCAILLDLVMPKMGGLQVLKTMNETKLIQRIPVIIITGASDDENTLESYALGASDMVHKPFNSEVITRRVNNVVDLYAHKNNLEEKLEEQKLILLQQNEKLKQANLLLIEALATTVEFRSLESGEHVRRVSNLTRTFLEILRPEYPLSSEQIESISRAAVVHDIGKVAIPDSVLLKPGRFTPEEFEIMKTHTVQGCKILDSIGSMPEQEEFFQYCYDICRHHHERWDGRGYPDGLAGDAIPIWAQAVSLADVYDALTSDRVYKKACSHETAVHMILDGQCGQFNPALVAQFRAHQNELPYRVITNREALISG